MTLRIVREKDGRGAVDNPVGLCVAEFAHQAGELAAAFIDDGGAVSIGLVLADIIDLVHATVDAIGVDPVDFMELQEMRRAEKGRYGKWVAGE